MQKAERDEAFSQYVAARRPHLRRFAYTLCGSWDQADDLVQTALTKLYLAWPRIERKQAHDSYTRRIILNARIDETRRPWRRETPGLDGLDVAEPAAAEPHGFGPALWALPAMQRKVIVLRHWLDLSVDDTARELGIRPGTVKAHHHRAIHRLRELLGEEPYPGQQTDATPTSKGSRP